MNCKKVFNEFFKSYQEPPRQQTRHFPRKSHEYMTESAKDKKNRYPDCCELISDLKFSFI